ncbi:aldo/keto reductase [Levilactobacillus suantsaii]|uniref:Aldo/keto reductase n=1 Tax=Levilactobacillus suantsaii TaxID=2292255 RepID=A0A4Q0VIF1_9LACO|nr:aldo/keto reductase [Levilactobacillus suantsaii]QMU08794.1 aldo/keto reductase [Levilactobacillus suantsaii]RXI78963.1 aldo/keto reductase [Levilactobacillus suantsaii]
MMETTQTRQLANGLAIPSMGFGTILPADQVTSSVVAAFNAGYRLIDTAEAYHNEAAVGAGIRQAIADGTVTRENIFISSKVWFVHRSYQSTLDAFDESLRLLGLDYLDGYLVHWPANSRWHANWRELNAETWRAFETLYQAGKVRAIGVSNFSVHQLEALIADTSITPMLNQLEYHPDFSQPESAQFDRQEKIVTEAWRPLGGPGGHVLANSVIQELAHKYDRQPTQIILRWLTQLGIVPLPKSINPAHMAANLASFDFKLSHADLDLISNLPQGSTQYDPETYHS